MRKKYRPSIPDYAAAHKATVRYTREASSEGCEICGTHRKLYVFTLRRSKRLRCSCRKHLRRIK